MLECVLGGSELGKDEIIPLRTDMIHRRAWHPDMQTLKLKTQNSPQRIGFFGGVYSNYLALQALLEDARARGSSNSTVWEISVHSVPCPIELARFCVKLESRSFEETTTTRLATDSPIANAATPTLAITISPSYLTTTRFGTRVVRTKTGCGNFH